MRLRHLTVTACLILTAAIFPACKSSAPASPTPAAADAILSDKGLTLDGKLIPVPFTEKQITDILGPPSRTSAKDNTILTWDDKGILAYIVPATGRGRAIDIILRPKAGLDFAPKSVFPHAIFVGDKPLTAASTRADIQAAGFVQIPPVNFLFHRNLGDLEVMATASDTVDALEDVNVEAVLAP